MKDSITKLLGLKDAIVENVYEDADGCHIEMELPQCEHRCPCKVLKRVCFGVKNFDTFRNRILHCDPTY